MAVSYKQFESEFGFKSPNFLVDDDGNVTLRSINYIDPVDEEAALDADYTVTDTGGAFYFEELVQTNPTLSFIRGQAYTFQINLVSITFNLYGPETFYNEGLRFTENGENFLEGSNAQNQSTGFIIFTVPGDAPDQLFIRDAQQNVTCIINIEDPVFTGNGNFNNLTVTGNVNMLGSASQITIAPSGTGRLTINPVTGFIANMDITAKTLSATDTVTLTPIARNVTIAPSNTGQLIIDSGVTGSLNNINIGTTTPASGNFTELTSTSGTLNNTVIGDITPTTGNFTRVSLQQSPVNATDVANKGYVDGAVTALAIAFGL